MRALPRLRLRFRRTALPLSVLLAAISGVAAAQVPVQVRPGQQLPSPDQAKQMLQSQPDMVRQLRERLQESGLTDDQIREWMVNPAEMTKKTKAERKPLMRAYPNLSKSDLDAVIAYMSSLKKK